MWTGWHWSILINRSIQNHWWNKWGLSNIHLLIRVAYPARPGILQPTSKCIITNAMLMGWCDQSKSCELQYVAVQSYCKRPTTLRWWKTIWVGNPKPQVNQHLLLHILGWAMWSRGFAHSGSGNDSKAEIYVYLYIYIYNMYPSIYAICDLVSSHHLKNMKLETQQRKNPFSHHLKNMKLETQQPKNPLFWCGWLSCPSTFPMKLKCSKGHFLSSGVVYQIVHQFVTLLDKSRRIS